MYLVQVDHTVYKKRGGEAFTLVEAMRELRGCGNARVLRADGTLVVRHAGSTEQPWTHVPTGRQIRHRLTRWARERWFAEVKARQAERDRLWREAQAKRLALV